MGAEEPTTPELQPLNFIPDEVADEDSFGSHSRIAAALALIIRTKKDLKVIGLLGSWGSGKSTVVKFVREHLALEDKSERVICFTYDAWLHQSDPPRRAFLESLIRFLISHRLTTEELWADRLKELNRQIEDTESTSTPTLSAAGRWLLPSALAVPLGMTLLGHDWFLALSKAQANWFERWAFCGGAVLVALPLLVAAALNLFWRPVRAPWKRKFWSKENWTDNRTPYERESILSIFTNREVLTQKNRTTRSPDPTTIEFQSLFRKIMSAVSADNRRFIFVVDNLDRLPEGPAIEMWATIRSFFLGSAHGVNLPTVILPIDEHAVQRMYAVDHDDKKTARSLAKSFMDKTFDLTFHVTPPVLSNWQSYLKEKLTYLFGSVMQQEWPYIVGAVYDRWLTTNQSADPVTPRVINTLLNSIGTLWLQWKDSDIPFASVAYYAINRDKIDRDILKAVEEDRPDIEAYDAGWRRAIVALHFGVEPADASQVLLEQPLRRAIAEGTEEEFLRLADVSGSDYVIDRILDAAIKTQSPLPVGRAVLYYDRLDRKPDANSIAAWQQLRALWTRNAEPTAFGGQDVKTIEILIRRCDGLNLKSFLQGAATRLSQVPGSALAKDDAIARFVDGVRIIFTSAKGTGLDPPRVVVQGDPKDYLKAVALCAGDNELLKCLATNTAAGRIVDALAQNLGDPAAAQDMDVSLKGLISIPGKWQWEPVVNAAGTKLESGSDGSTAVSANCLGLLQSSQSAASGRVQQLVDSGQLINRFHEAFNAEEMTTAAAIAALILTTNDPAVLKMPDGTNVGQTPGTPAQLAQLIGEALIAFGGAADMQAYVKLATEHAPLQPLLRAIATSRFRSGTLEMPSADALLANYAGYTECLDPDLLIPFLCEAASAAGFWEKLADLSLAVADPILKALLDEKSSKRDQGASATLEKLNSLVPLEWERAVDSGAEPFELVRSLRAVNGAVELGGNLFDALRQRTAALASSGNQSYRERWLELADFLSSSARKTLLKIVADYICRVDATPEIIPLLTMRDGVVLTEGEFSRQADGAATHVVLPLLAESSGLIWLEANAERLATVVAESDKDTVATIRERLLGMWQATDEADVKQRLDSLREKWGLAGFEPEAMEEPEAGAA